MKLLQSQLVLSQHARITYSVTLTEGEYDDLFLSETWAHVAGKVPTDSIIEVRPADRSWFALLYVVSANDKEVQVAPLLKTKLKVPEVKRDESEYSVQHRGRSNWSVIRKTDRTVMVENLDTMEAAKKWLKNPPPITKAA